MRYLPELQARRDKQIKDGLLPDFLDCDSCMVTATEMERSCLGCGFLPASKRTPGDRPFDSTVCPGYAARLPEVAEAARALSWSKRGGLVPLYGARELPPVAVEAIDMLEGAVGKVERDLIRQSQERVGDGA